MTIVFLWKPARYPVPDLLSPLGMATDVRPLAACRSDHWASKGNHAGRHAANDLEWPGLACRPETSLAGEECVRRCQASYPVPIPASTNSVSCVCLRGCAHSYAARVSEPGKRDHRAAPCPPAWRVGRAWMQVYPARQQRRDVHTLPRQQMQRGRPVSNSLAFPVGDVLTQQQGPMRSRALI